MFRNLKPPKQKPRRLLSWLTSKEKHGLFSSQKAGNYFKTSRHKNSPTYCTRGTEITTTVFLHKIAPKKQRRQNGFMQEQFFSTNFQTLGSPCCNWWSSWLSLLSLWIGRQDLHIATLSNLRLQVTAFIAAEKNIYFQYLYTCTCICCLHNLTHLYLLYITVSYKMYKCVCIWCKCTPFAVSDIPTQLRQKNRTNHVHYKYLQKTPSHLVASRQRKACGFFSLKSSSRT